MLCVGETVLIYRIPPPSRLVMDWDPEVGYQSDQGITEPMWTYSKHPITLITPSFSFDGVDSYLLVVQDTADVVGFHIPLSADQQPCVRFRMSHRSMGFSGLGLYKGYTASRGAPFLRFRYKWNGDVPNKFLRTKHIKYSPVWDEYFDEETGRCVFQLGSKKIKVVDFV